MNRYEKNNELKLRLKLEDQAEIRTRFTEMTQKELKEMHERIWKENLKNQA